MILRNNFISILIMARRLPGRSDDIAWAATKINALTRGNFKIMFDFSNNQKIKINLPFRELITQNAPPPLQRHSIVFNGNQFMGTYLFEQNCMSQRICAARMINEIMYRDCRYANCQLCTNLIPCNGAVLVVVVVLSSSFWRTRWEWKKESVEKEYEFVRSSCQFLDLYL